MKIKRFDESVKDYLKPKSKEEIRKSIFDKPLISRYSYIEENELESLFDEKELDEFYDNNLDGREIGKWYCLESKNKTYYAVIKNNNEIDDYTHFLEKDFIVFNEKMVKIEYNEEEYNEFYNIVTNI